MFCVNCLDANYFICCKLDFEKLIFSGVKSSIFTPFERSFAYVWGFLKAPFTPYPKRSAYRSVASDFHTVTGLAVTFTQRRGNPIRFAEQKTLRFRGDMKSNPVRFVAA